MKFALKCGLTAAAILSCSPASFAGQPAGSLDTNTTVRHSSPTLTAAPSDCATDGATAGAMTAHNNAAGTAPTPVSGSALIASDAGTAGNTAAGGMGSHNSAGGGAIGHGLNAGSMISPAGTAHTDVSYNINKCTGTNTGGRAAEH